MPLDPDEQMWVCDVCGDVRPDNCISVYTVDISDDLGVPKGTAKRNFKYCNDRRECIEGVKRKKGL